VQETTRDLTHLLGVVWVTLHSRFKKFLVLSSFSFSLSLFSFSFLLLISPSHFSFSFLTLISPSHFSPSFLTLISHPHFSPSFLTLISHPHFSASFLTHISHPRFSFSFYHLFLMFSSPFMDKKNIFFPFSSSLDDGRGGEKERRRTGIGRGKDEGVFLFVKVNTSKFHLSCTI
jgi:hypothetical protein